MVADTHKLSQPPSSSSAVEDDALRRNTDCVYFLASPLTCKKGSECEYRHSEYARVNPRDCWFWLNGNCLNPKCSFRHPPLDGLLGTQTEISTGPSLAPSQPAVSAAMHVPSNAGKQAVPCIFFQKGMCLKGDRCAFLHGPSPINNKMPQAPTAPSVTEPPSLKRAFGGLAKCSQEQKVSLQADIAKPVEATNLKLVPKTENAPLKNEVFIPKNIPPSTAFDAEIRCEKNTSPAIINESSISRPNHMHQSHVSDDHSFENGKDVDEYIRESSPGFDVLVDDELRDPDYYRNEDQYGRTRGHEDQFDLAHPADYSSMIEIDRERFHDLHGFDSYERMQGQYAREPRRSSSERKFVGTTHVARRGCTKVENPDQIDLRHQLSKQRRVSGLRSVVCLGYDRESHIEDRSYEGSCRDSGYLSPQESSLGSRFRGRINLPRKSSPTSGRDLHLERDLDRERNRGRSSPGKPQISSQVRRFGDRIKGVVEEDFINKGRNFTNRGIMDDTAGADFAGPKSLAELKGGKNAESEERSFSSRRQRNVAIDGHQQSEGDLLFDGPKPLNMILKRKRGLSRDVTFCDNNEGSNEKENKVSLVIESQSILYSEPDNDEVCKSAAAEEAGKKILAYGRSSELPIGDGLGAEDGFVLDEMEDHEIEVYEQRGGEDEYEHYDGEEYDANGGKNAVRDEEYLEEDDDVEDDFAKKISVMFT